MATQLQYRKIFLIAFLLTTVLSNIAQQQFIHTATKANNSCNGDCTQLDIPELNNNPEAILYVTPVLDGGENLNPHLIGVYYFNKKWNIFNLDQKALPAGSKFNVQYFARADSMHFKYTITNDNIRRDGTAYIEHPALLNNPTIKFLLFPSWIPVNGGVTNRYEIKAQFDSVARKWFISNINERYLYARITYNIFVSSGDIVTKNPVINEKDSTSYKAVEIKELIIKATPPSTTISMDPTNEDSVTFEKNLKTMIKRDSLSDINTPIGKNATVKRDSLSGINSPINKNAPAANKTILTPYDFSKIHICIDKDSIYNLPTKPPFTAFPVIPKIKPNGELAPATSVTQPLSVLNNSMWSVGESISVSFLPGETLSVIDKIKKYAKEWETYANIRFVFINDITQAKIKVGFKKDGMSWSWFGRDVLANSKNEKTMNLGWLDDLTVESEFRRVVLHEFGHALGFVHEHQSPNAGIPWDTEKVYSFFAASPNYWNRAKVDMNIFNKYSKTSTNSSTYDKLSIMHYSFPAELTTDSSSVPQNTVLSTGDKTFAGQVYPYPPGPSTATGVLLTGDDCDEIEFKVEYNVVNNNEIAFILEPGRDANNNLITWWKKIAIPVIGNGEVGIEIQDGHSATKRVLSILIDKTRGIAFGKAKILGVHTGLAYTWKIWPAIVGGCRVTLVWRRDKCG